MNLLLSSALLSFLSTAALQASPPTQAAEALERLSSESPETREKAFQELKKIGKAAVATLKAALPGLKDPEVKARVGELLRILEPAALDALDAYLAAAKVEAGAIDVVKDPILEKALPQILFFQVWKKGQARAWKLLGYDREQRALSDWSEETPKVDADVRQRLAVAGSASHASIDAYSGAPSLTLILEGRALRLWVKADGNRMEARSLEGNPVWMTEIFPKSDVGTPVIRFIKRTGDRIELVVGKHTFVYLDAASGRILSRASD